MALLYSYAFDAEGGENSPQEIKVCNSVESIPLFAFHDFFTLERFRLRSENVSIRQRYKKCLFREATACAWSKEMHYQQVAEGEREKHGRALDLLLG